MSLFMNRISPKGQLKRETHRFSTQNYVLGILQNTQYLFRRKPQFLVLPVNDVQSLYRDRRSCCHTSRLSVNFIFKAISAILANSRPLLFSDVTHDSWIPEKSSIHCHSLIDLSPLLGSSCTACLINNTAWSYNRGTTKTTPLVPKWTHEKKQ